MAGIVAALSKLIVPALSREARGSRPKHTGDRNRLHSNAASSIPVGACVISQDYSHDDTQRFSSYYTTPQAVLIKAVEPVLHLSASFYVMDVSEDRARPGYRV